MFNKSKILLIIFVFGFEVLLTFKSVYAYKFCGLGQIYDNVSDSCKCLAGYRESNGICISFDQYCRDKYGIMANSDSSGSCKCAAGYYFKGEQCVPMDNMCKELFGSASFYGISGECECQSGYTFDDGKCRSAVKVCTENYGKNSTYNYASKQCECLVGYTFNQNGDECISLTNSCKENFGENAFAPMQVHIGNLPVTCECEEGYQFNSSQTECIKEKLPIYNLKPLDRKEIDKNEIITSAPETLNINQNNENKIKENQFFTFHQIAFLIILSSFFIIFIFFLLLIANKSK